ncbi:MAG: CoA transferase [Nitrospinae bacterium]|nr:CoA transferase [Nitrospinota bacterium]
MIRKALEGLVVLDLTRVYAGPYCSLVLADMGADVIKIERPGVGDDVRHIPPWFEGKPGLENSAYFFFVNRNKKGITLDIQHRKGQEILQAMVKQADVLLENYSPRVMRGLGLGYDVLSHINPRLIYCSICGYGHTGPYSNRPAYDIIAQSTGGIASLTGHPDGPPTRVGTSLGDVNAGIHAAFGIMCAAFAREKTGEGQWVDISQQDCIFAVLEAAVVTYTLTGHMPGRMGSRHPNVSPYDIFPCKNGYVCYAGYKQEHWSRTCAYFVHPELPHDPRIDTVSKRVDSENYATLIRPIIEGWFATYTREELARIGEELQVPLAPVLDVADCVNDPQLNAREMIVEVDHPVMGRVKLSGNPVKLSTTPGGIERAAPLLGQHNQEVYQRFLGYTPGDLQQLQVEGVI